MPPPPPKPSLLRNLGAFFGHIAHGVRSNPSAQPPTPRPAAECAAAPGPKVVRHEVAERTVHTPDGPVVLRRTVIDEVRPAAGEPPVPPGPAEP